MLLQHSIKQARIAEKPLGFSTMQTCAAFGSEREA
jgi:hypothetical protein